jgi:hypothetical protein
VITLPPGNLGGQRNDSSPLSGASESSDIARQAQFADEARKG